MAPDRIDLDAAGRQLEAYARRGQPMWMLPEKGLALVEAVRTARAASTDPQGYEVVVWELGGVRLDAWLDQRFDFGDGSHPQTTAEDCKPSCGVDDVELFLSRTDAEVLQLVLGTFVELLAGLGRERSRGAVEKIAERLEGAML
jgi:hypothetical protein